MVGRSKRNRFQQKAAPPADSGSIHGTGSLIGGSGVSLDGQSLQLPEQEYNDYDEISSINTSNYGGQVGPSLRVFGNTDDFDTDLEDESALGSPANGGKEPEILGEAVPADNGSLQKKSSSEDDTKKGAAAGGVCCFPAWLTGAPNWLKGVMVTATVLLIVAIVLIVIGATSSDDDNTRSETIGDPSVSFTLSPSVAPSPVPTTAQPSVMPFPGQTEFPTEQPSTSEPTIATEEPTLQPTQEPTLEPTLEPTAVPGTVVTFYTTAWRFQGAALTQVEEGLPLLPRDNDEFMVHLGDWNSPSITGCDEESYVEVTELYAPGPPTFFVVGDNEYNDCPVPVFALELWRDYLVDYESNYGEVTLPYTVERQFPDYSENWAFVHQELLFIGINLVGGDFHDAQEWEDRHAANLEWIDANYEASDGAVVGMVIFAHAGPTLQANAPFYDGLAAFVSGIELSVVMVNRNLVLEEWGIQQDFRGIPDFSIVTVEGALWPPMRLQWNVGTGAISINQDTWFDDEVLGGDDGT